MAIKVNDVCAVEIVENGWSTWFLARIHVLARDEDILIFQIIGEKFERDTAKYVAVIEDPSKQAAARRLAAVLDWKPRQGFASADALKAMILAA